MSDSCGQATALTVLTRVESGREEPLREVLTRFEEGTGSPFAQLPGTHFARWVLVPSLQQGTLQLLFSSSFDGPDAAYIASICADMGATADAVWGNCPGYPGSADPEAFGGYMRANRVQTGVYAVAYPDATVDEVRGALALRERLREFAESNQGEDDETLQRRFTREFAR